MDNALERSRLIYRLEKVLARDSLNWNLGSRKISSDQVQVSMVRFGMIDIVRNCAALFGTVRNPIIFSSSMIQIRFHCEVVFSANYFSGGYRGYFLSMITHGFRFVQILSYKKYITKCSKPRNTDIEYQGKVVKLKPITKNRKSSFTMAVLGFKITIG